MITVVKTFYIYLIISEYFSGSTVKIVSSISSFLITPSGKCLLKISNWLLIFFDEKLVFWQSSLKD